MNVRGGDSHFRFYLSPKMQDAPLCLASNQERIRIQRDQRSETGLQ